MSVVDEKSPALTLRIGIPRSACPSFQSGTNLMRGRELAMLSSSESTTFHQ